MKHRRLGNSDLEVSEISLGSWLTYSGGVERAAAERCVAHAFELGINFIDTANIYGRGAAETFLGEVLAGRKRDSYVLATKLYFPMTDSEVKACTGMQLVEAIQGIFNEVVPSMNACMQVHLEAKDELPQFDRLSR